MSMLTLTIDVLPVAVPADSSLAGASSGLDPAATGREP